MPGLAGLRIVVTRAVHQAEELAVPLRMLGAEVLLAPMIGIGPPLDDRPLRNVAAHVANYDWVIFTSANSVTAFSSAIQFAGTAVSSLTAKIATVGNATRAAAEAQGFVVSVTPDDYVAESLVDALGRQQVEGKRILLPGAAVTRDVVPQGLGKLGGIVTVVEAYRNVLPPEAQEDAHRVFRDPLPDWVIFASSSAAKNSVSVVAPVVLRAMKIASIGPITTRTIEQLGLTVSAEASPHTVNGLLHALIDFYGH